MDARRMPAPRRRPGFALLDVLVAVVVLVGLAGLFLAYAAKQLDRGSAIRCASNLRAISQHAFIYANSDVRGGQRFPRTFHDPAAPLDRSLVGNVVGSKAFDPANPAATPVGANNVPAAFYLLLTAADLSPEVFVCDYGDADVAYGGRDVAARANWPAPYAAFNSYSYNCPYPSAAAVKGGWRFDQSLGPDYPLAADINPGDMPGGGPTTVAFTAGRKAMRRGNSPNHGFEGQQVAYCDAHVEWQTSPFCGFQRAGEAFRDNIYASTAGGVAPDGVGGTVWAPPQDAADAVLLPTAQESPGSAIADRRVDADSPARSRRLSEAERWLMVPAGAGVALCALMGYKLVARRRRRRARAMGAASAAPQA